MCGDVEWPEFYDSRWQRARIRHRCPICRETIPAGHRYHVSAGKWDGEFRQYTHCARCWEMYQRLNDQLDGEAALELDCGEVYDGDDETMLALAFVTPQEAQAFAPLAETVRRYRERDYDVS